MDILRGNANGYFMGKCQWTLCGEMPMDILGGNNKAHLMLLKISMDQYCCGEKPMDILWGNGNGHFVGKWQWTFCGEMAMDILRGNADGHFVGKCRWTFCGQMPMDILWANANSHVNYSLLPFNHALNRSGACS